MKKSISKMICRGIIPVLALNIITAIGISNSVFADTNLGFSIIVPDIPILEVALTDPNGTSIGSAASIDVAPASLASAGFNEKNMVINVGTNNEYGYTLVMNVSSTALISQEDSSNTIANLVSKEGGYTCTSETAATCDFTVNSWGFKIKNATNLSAATNYIPVQSSYNLNKSTVAVNSETTSVAFGSRINAAQAPGTYTATINFAVVTNPDPTPLMQDMTKSTLASLLPSSGSTTTLKDSRGGKKYSIANIDGNYWMTKNLDLPGGTTLTPADSNVSSNYTLPASSTEGFSDDATAYVYNSNSTTCGNDSPCYSYYSYVAATAGTGANLTSGEATSDICPKSWRLPTKAEYDSLKATYTTGDTLTAAPFSGVYAGYYYNSSFRYGGSDGYYWSSTAYSASSAYYLNFYSSNANTYRNSKRSGYSVRCVYGPLPTMQNVDSAKLAQLMPTDGSTTTLPDSRDGNVYNITRIGDAYWMTDNLKIMGTISAADSNFTGADFNISAGGDLTAGNTYTEPRAHYNTSDTNSSTYGAYYNYCAASAGTVCSETTKQDATSDICPKGWRLPTQTEAQAFASASSSNKNPVLAGYYYGGSLSIAGSYGFWWSATAYNTNGQYLLYCNGSSWNVVSYDKNFGYSVRCMRSL